MSMETYEELLSTNQIDKAILKQNGKSQKVQSY